MVNDQAKKILILGGYGRAGMEIAQLMAGLYNSYWRKDYFQGRTGCQTTQYQLSRNQF